MNTNTIAVMTMGPEGPRGYTAVGIELKSERERSYLEVRTEDGPKVVYEIGEGQFQWTYAAPNDFMIILAYNNL